jgi:2-oxoglutarate dehydrogenase E2 component (dihydrolipoamide succinyltransferase)
MNTKTTQTQKEIKVPPMGESITEATIARWLKKQGEAVTLDEPVAELETDKVTLEISSPTTGILSQILIPEGETVEIGTVIGQVIEGATESVPTEVPEKKATEIPEKKAPANIPSPPISEDVPLSPAVRKLVAESQVDPRQIQGQGKAGRLTKSDVLSFLDKEKVADHPEPAPQQRTEERVERVRMSRLRQRIAERLKEAQNTAAILTTFNEADMTNIIALRNQLKESFEKRHGVKLGFMSFFVKACLIALKEIPAVNAEIEGDELIYKKLL